MIDILTAETVALDLFNCRQYLMRNIPENMLDTVLKYQKIHNLFGSVAAILGNPNLQDRHVVFCLQLVEEAYGKKKLHKRDYAEQIQLLGQKIHKIKDKNLLASIWDNQAIAGGIVCNKLTPKEKCLEIIEKHRTNFRNKKISVENICEFMGYINERFPDETAQFAIENALIAVESITEIQFTEKGVQAIWNAHKKSSSTRNSLSQFMVWQEKAPQDIFTEAWNDDFDDSDIIQEFMEHTACSDELFIRAWNKLKTLGDFNAEIICIKRRGTNEKIPKVVASEILSNNAEDNKFLERHKTDIIRHLGKEGQQMINGYLAATKLKE